MPLIETFAAGAVSFAAVIAETALGGGTSLQALTGGIPLQFGSPVHTGAVGTDTETPSSFVVAVKEADSEALSGLTSDLSSEAWAGLTISSMPSSSKIWALRVACSTSFSASRISCSRCKAPLFCCSSIFFLS